MGNWQRTRWLLGFYLTAWLSGLLLYSESGSESFVLLDFRESDHGWHGNPRVENFRQDPDAGLVFESVGHDPWIEGPPPPRLPHGERLLLTIRMRSTGDAGGELFYGRTFAAERRLAFVVRPDGEWHDYEVMLPPQEEGSRLRLDPAADEGEFAVKWIRVELLRPLASVELPAPVPAAAGEEATEVRFGALTVRHGGRHWDGFEVWVDGERMAAAPVNERIGYVSEEGPGFLELAEAQAGLRIGEGKMVVEAEAIDSGGGRWVMRREFRPHRVENAAIVETSVKVDRDRRVFHLPWLVLFPGIETFEERKTQALLPGVEYLSDEPSSSEADLEGEQAIRRIVEGHKLTSPFMALSHRGRYVGLAWERADRLAAVFDSPDRLYGSGAHVMALWQPEVGLKRLENEVDPLLPVAFEAGRPRTVRAVIFGGRGESVVPAIRDYVEISGGLPPAPEFEGGLAGAVELLAAGWLDSAAHHDGLWRHAVWGDAFPPQVAADAPSHLLWLAAHAEDPDLVERLERAAGRAIERLGEASAFTENVGHVSRPVPPLVFGRIDRFVSGRVTSARRSLARFDGEGLLRYVRAEGRPDYGRTHYADHANGYGATELESILEAAAFSGDEKLIADALALLDKQAGHYHGTVPRGAQTWEIGLHTPDILASARMVRCYVLGYQLTGNSGYLEQARYWAWTGLPFVYLDPPVEEPVGLFATIAVLGATNWTTPNWIGLPVQWCGLVYRSALVELAAVDPEEGNFWDDVARGITLSGLQQTFPLEDERRRGLLPDFFHLKVQASDGPAIVPGTVQAHLGEAYGATPWFQSRRVSESGSIAFAPGAIDAWSEAEGRLSVEVRGWPSEPYWVRITRISGEPSAVRWNGREAPFVFDADRRALNVRVEGTGSLEVEMSR